MKRSVTCALGLLHKVRPVAAMDYFLRTKLLAWFALNIIGILPISRKIKSDRKDKENPLAACSEALAADNILIFFPEGSRGEPEQMQHFKGGIARLAQQHPNVPVIPIYLHGLGKALPKGESLLVPFFCDIFVGDALAPCENKNTYMENLEKTFQHLAEQGRFQTWN